MSCATSSHSENERCSKPTVECDANHQFENLFDYMSILHKCTLFKMHARCHGRRRVTLRTIMVVSQLFSATSRPTDQSSIRIFDYTNVSHVVLLFRMS